MSVFVEYSSNIIGLNELKKKNISEKWDLVQKDAAQKTNLIADTRAIAPRPFAPDAMQLFRAVLPKNFNKNQFIYSQNGLPMNSMILNTEISDGSVFLSDKIARAALKANSNIQFIIPVAEKFTSTDDITYRKRLKNISDTWQIPAKNIVLVSSSMGQWPQDGIAFGKSGIIRGNPKTDTWHKTKINEATDIASALGLSVVEEGVFGRFGDTQFFSKKDGSQIVVFGSETIERAAKNYFSSDDYTNSERMIVINHIMKIFKGKGIPLSNIMPIGEGKLSYGDVLKSMSSFDKQKIDPEIMSELIKRQNLPFPKYDINYHTDMTILSPGNDVAFVNESDKEQYPYLITQLKYLGLKPVSLPSFNKGSQSSNKINYMASIGVDVNELKHTNADIWGSYLNAISGVTLDGKIAILLPTESRDPEHLTENDKMARKIIVDSLPNSIVIPIGGFSALQVKGRVPLIGGGQLRAKDYGPHCLSKLTPFIIQPVKLKR
jgi:hypothetical protein